MTRIASRPANRRFVPAIARLALAAGIPLLPARGLAHMAPSGWMYPMACCSNKDCHPVEEAKVSEVRGGYVVETTGEMITYTDYRVKTSPDGLYHICSLGGADDGRTLCLFVPPKSF